MHRNNLIYKKGISIFLIFLLSGISLGSSHVFAQADTAEHYDTDLDGVCNWKKDDDRYNGKEEVAKRFCQITPFGDLCPRTEGRAGHYGSQDSGCSNEQLQRTRDYWSVSAGDFQPSFLKVNWLTDSKHGARAYQVINLNKNFRTDTTNVELRDVSVSCSSDKAIAFEGSSISREVPGNFVEARVLPVPLENRKDESRMLELKFNQLREDFAWDVDEIRTSCTVRTSSCINVVNENEKLNCVNLYPPEADTIEIRFPVDSEVFRPEAALDRGIQISEDVLDLTNKLIPKVDRFYRFTLKWCGYSLAVVSATKLFGSFLGISEIADFIWYGPEKWRSISLTRPGLKTDSEGKPVRKSDQYNSFIVSGRSMCAAAVCPNDWCRLANSDVISRISGGNADGGGKTSLELLGQTKEGRPKEIQDSLILSVGCGCISGILSKLYQLRALASSWNSCLLQAKAGEQFKGSCDQILSNGICTFVFDELTAFGGINLMGIAYDKVFKGVAQEVLQALRLHKKQEDSRDIFGDFADSEVKALGQAYGVGTAGYRENSIGRSICSLAVYGRLPETNLYGRFDVDKSIIKTSANINWDSKKVIEGPTGQPLFEYSVEWMVVSGRDNLRYKVFLRTENGGEGPRLDRGSGRLSELGDYDSDYIQFLDVAEYVEACVDIPDEFISPKCFSPGTGSGFGITGDFFGFSSQDDDDKDGLPNEWEVKYTDFGMESNNWDTDGDGIPDGGEDPDNDGITNYNEFKDGTHPGEAGVKEDGTIIESDCKAVFESDALTDKVVYDLGESISLKNAKVKSESSNVVIKAEITERRGDFRKNIYVPVGEIRNAMVKLWDVPTSGGDVPPKGVYDVKLSLLKWEGAFSKEVCVDNAGRISNSVKRSQIYLGKAGGCVDSDGDDLHTKGLCVSNNEPQGKVDSCSSNGEINEYICSSNSCVVSDSKCSDVETCNDGVCVLKSNVDTEKGICFSENSNQIFLDRCDENDNTRIKIKYLNKDNKCIEMVSACGQNEICEEETVVLKEDDVMGRKSLIGKEIKVGKCVSIADPVRISDSLIASTQNNLKKRGISNYIYSKSKEFGIDFDLVLAVITVESAGDPDAISSKGAIGLMQLNPNNPGFKDKNLRDPRINIDLGVSHLSDMISRYGEDKGLAAYNAGEPRLNGWYGCIDEGNEISWQDIVSSKKIIKTSKPNLSEKCHMPVETFNYVPKVLGYKILWKNLSPT